MPGLDPLDVLRQELRTAAHREVATTARRRRPWMPVATGLAILVASGGVATAIEFLSVGKEQPGNPQSARRYGPETGTGMIAVRADDPARTLPWGVLAYKRPDGEECALAGEVRGQDLGVEEDGSFRPFGDRSGAACGRLGGAHKYFYDVRTFGDRSVVYGRAATNVPEMTVWVAHHRSRTARVGPGGAFLFVFEGRMSIADFQLRADR